MRVAMVVPRFPEPSETFIAAKFAGLLDRGLDVHVVCGEEGDWSRAPELAGDPELKARVHVTGPRSRPLTAATRLTAVTLRETARRPRSARRFVATPRKGRALERLGRLAKDAVLLRLRPDLVHIEFGYVAVHVAHLADALDCPLVVSLRGADMGYVGLAEPDFYTELWRRVAAVHCLGEDLWDRALARGCPPETPHALIPPAVDSDFFSPAPRPARSSECARLLSIGRLHWKKGHEYALQAVRRLLDGGHDVEYRIVGEGPHEDAVRACVRDLCLDDRVHLLGDVARDAVREELRAADVLLQTSVSEGFGNAPLEAQAVEVPVVASDADGLREAVFDGVSGFVVPRRDPIATADRVGRLVADVELRARMGAAGRARMVRHFHPDRQLEAFVELYRRVAAPQPRRALGSPPGQGGKAREPA